MESKKRYVILTGGTLNERFLKTYLDTHKIDKIICVDGALHIVDSMKLSIDYLVGDFDTVSQELLKKYQRDVCLGKKKIEIKQYNPVKDETDTEIAIAISIENGADEIVLFGATGSRIDHMLANIHLLMKPLSMGIHAYIIDEFNKIYLIDKNTTIRKNELYGPYLSLIPFDGNVTNVTLKGFKYDVSNLNFKIGQSLGISNELLEEEGQIDWDNGIFAVFEVKD